jgi:hypothetical protein
LLKHSSLRVRLQANATSPWGDAVYPVVEAALVGGPSEKCTRRLRLGNGTTTDSHVPVRVSSTDSFAESFVTAAFQDYIGRAPTGAEVVSGLAVNRPRSLEAPRL